MMFYANFSASGLTDDDTDDIQWMPPGVQTVSPHTPEGKVVTVTILVDEAAAARVEECRARYQAEFDAGTGDAPYIDFLHADGEASAWVNRVYWGGDDPKTGGIRLVVSWTDEGAGQEGQVPQAFFSFFRPLRAGRRRHLHRDRYFRQHGRFGQPGRIQSHSIPFCLRPCGRWS